MNTQPVPSLPDLAFRGDRDYLHSTTVFDVLLCHDPAPENIEFVFHKITACQCECLLGQGDESEEKVVATYQSDGLTCRLVETDTPISQRHACNEKSILQAATITESHVTFDMPPIDGATYIEAIVAAYKEYLLLHIPELSGKPLFGRVNLKYVPADGNCRVRHRRVLGGTFFQADLAHQEQPIGQLYFGVG